MPLIRKQLKPSEVYPDTIRYNPTTETVQSFIDGEWVDNPSADPRSTTLFPPRITSDSRCDAAQSVADAFKNQIDSIILAIDNAATAFAIAGLVLGLLSFGVFAIFISIALAIADAMIGAGGSALTAALTPAVWETFVCILYCNMESNGRLQPGSMATIQADVATQIGGLAGTTINAFIALAGEGGINNLASLGTSTGDCTSCTDCDCVHDYDIFLGNFLGIGNDSGGHYIEIQSVLATYAGTNRNWAVLGGSERDFCCNYQGFSVTSGGIDGGQIFDCSGLVIGTVGIPTGEVRFAWSGGTFSIKYYVT